MATATIIQDVKYETWGITFGGFSADPTGVTARRAINGKKCTIKLNSSNPGTSNATTFTFTLPFAAASTEIFTCVGMNNGTQQQCRIQIAAGSNICSCFATVAGGAWTASGSKMIYPAGFTYEIQ